jgi:hypothetical protein
MKRYKRKERTLFSFAHVQRRSSTEENDICDEGKRKEKGRKERKFKRKKNELFVHFLQI